MASLWFAGPYLPVRLFSYSHQARTPAWGPGAIGCGCSRSARLTRRNVRVSQVPGEPWCAYAVFLDPGGNAPPMAVGRNVMAPTYGNSKGSPRVRQSAGSET